MRDTGIETVRRTLTDAVSSLEHMPEADAAVEQLVSREARRRVHQVTGRLAASIGPGQANSSALITAGGSAARYAAPEEDRHPYLNPAAAAVLDQAVDLYTTAVAERLETTIRGA